MIRPVEHEDLAGLTDEAWLAALKASVVQPVQHELSYPGFPEESVQRAFVGSAYEHALQEADQFYRFTRSARSRFSGRCRARRYLDFGCGWGRFGRFFLRDFHRGDMAGVDVDPEMIDFCIRAGVPGHHLTISNDRKLPFADEAFEIVTAYSVFTHLPERLFLYWLSELLRVTARNGIVVFTVEPPRFLDFIAGIDAAAPESGWHAALALNQPDLEQRRTELERQGLVYLPTGGGPYRPPETYGDTVVTRAFLERACGRRGRLRDYVDDPAAFWQAVAVVQRTR